MTETAQRLAIEISALSPADRAELAYVLNRSLDEGDASLDPHANSEYRREIARRVAEIKNGTAKGYPAQEALAQLLEKYS